MQLMWCRRPSGFSLVEVLVSLVVIAVGLLGIAKIQGLAFSETGTASDRSLAAIEASSLAAAMHANRGYWAVGGGVSNPAITVTATTVTATDANMTTALGSTRVTTNGCSNAVSPHCTGVEIAANDVTNWVASLRALLPMSATDNTTVNCSTASSPVNCTITIMWTEKAVAINAQGQQGATAANGGMQAPTYTLYVEP
jgi:type IV pilus assembly protein PilV